MEHKAQIWNIGLKWLDDTQTYIKTNFMYSQNRGDRHISKKCQSTWNVVLSWSHINGKGFLIMLIPNDNFLFLTSPINTGFSLREVKVRNGQNFFHKIHTKKYWSFFIEIIQTNSVFSIGDLLFGNIDFFKEFITNNFFLGRPHQKTHIFLPCTFIT